MKDPKMMPLFPPNGTVEALRHWAKMTAHDGPTGYALESSANFLENVRRMILAGIEIVPRLEPNHPESLTSAHPPSWDWEAEARRLYGGRIKADEMARAVARLLESLCVTLANSDTFVAVVGRDLDAVRASLRPPAEPGSLDDIAERLRQIAENSTWPLEAQTIRVAAQHIDALEDQARQASAEPDRDMREVQSEPDSSDILDWLAAFRRDEVRLGYTSEARGIAVAEQTIRRLTAEVQAHVDAKNHAAAKPEQKASELEPTLEGLKGFAKWLGHRRSQIVSELDDEWGGHIRAAIPHLEALASASDQETATLKLCSSTGALRETIDTARTHLLKLQAELLQRQPMDEFRAGVEAVARAIETGEVMAPMAEDLLRDLVRSIRDVVKAGEEGTGPAIGQTPGIQEGPGYYPSGAVVLLEENQRVVDGRVVGALPEGMERLKAEARASAVARASKCGVNACRNTGVCSGYHRTGDGSACFAHRFEGDGR